MLTTIGIYPPVKRLIAMGDVHGDLRVTLLALKLAEVIPQNSDEKNVDSIQSAISVALRGSIFFILGMIPIGFNYLFFIYGIPYLIFFLVGLVFGTEKKHPETFIKFQFSSKKSSFDLDFNYFYVFLCTLFLFLALT